MWEKLISGLEETGIAPDHFNFNDTQSVLPKLWLVHWEDHKITLSWWILSHENPWIWANFQDFVMSKYHNISCKFWDKTMTIRVRISVHILQIFKILVNMNDGPKWNPSRKRLQERGLYVNIFINMSYVWGIDFHKYCWNNLRMFTLLAGDNITALK